MARGGWGPQVPGGPVGLPPLVEQPDLPIRVPSTRASRFMVFVLRPAWLWRRELLLLNTLAVLTWAAWLAGDWPGGLAVFGLLVGLLAGIAPVRRRLARVYRHARVRREWDSSVRYAGLATSNDRVPRIVAVSDTAAGERLRVRMPGGLAVPDLEDRAEHVAAGLEVREVRVSRDPGNARFAHVEIARRDPLGDRGAVAWPWRDVWRSGTPVSMWDPLPVAVGEDGALITILWFEDEAGDGGDGE